MKSSLITFLGLAAGACTTVSMLPQAIKTIRTKQTKDLSLWMYLLLVIGIILWLSYGLFIQDVPVIAANGVTLIFAFIVLAYKIKYK